MEEKTRSQGPDSQHASSHDKIIKNKKGKKPTYKTSTWRGVNM